MAQGTLQGWDKTKFNFRQFPSLTDFIEQTRKAIKKAEDYLAPGDVFSYQVIEIKQNNIYRFETAKNYESPAQLQKWLGVYDEVLSEIDMGGTFKKSRIIVTDDKRGMFDFGLASKGLYNPVEYFSRELALELPDEFNTRQYGFLPSGIVPVELVKEAYVLDEKQFWYTSFTTNKKYQVFPQKQGERAVQLGLPGARLVYKTTTRKSYLMFEKKGGKAKMVELYIPIHKSVTLVNMIPILLVAKYLQYFNIMTRISILRLYNEKYTPKHQRTRGSQFIAWGMPIKEYEDEIDFDQLALKGVDDRVWDLIRVGVRAINDLEIAEQKGLKNLTKTEYNIFDGQGVPPNSRQSYLEIFDRYKNWYAHEIKEGRLEPFSVDKKLILLGVNKGASADTKEGVIKEFNTILDLVDFQFNKVELVAKRIYKRMVEDKMDMKYMELIAQMPFSQVEPQLKRLKTTLTAEFKSHVQSLLFETYAYPVGGEWAESPENADKLESELDEKLEKLNDFLKTVN